MDPLCRNSVIVVLRYINIAVNQRDSARMKVARMNQIRLCLQKLLIFMPIKANMKRENSGRIFSQ